MSEDGKAAFATFAAAGVEFSAPVVLLTLVGAWLDSHFAWQHIGVICGGILGALAGFVNLWRLAKAMERRSESE